MLLVPHAHSADGAEGEEDAEGDAEAPDGLHLEAGGLGGAGPDPVVDLGHVVADGGEKGGGGAPGGGQGGTVEVREGLADGDGDRDDRDEDGGVQACGDEERENGVEVEDGGYGDVEDGDAGLRGC